MSILEYAFPGSSKMEELHYCVFPEILEDNPQVLFHATRADDFEKILLSGFKTAAELGLSDGLQSVSYAKRSSAALGHIRTRHKYDEVVIVAVEFAAVTARPGMTVNSGDIHVYDGTQPTIIGFCRVPEGYLFV